jgi:hypothetical protein
MYCMQHVQRKLHYIQASAALRRFPTLCITAGRNAMPVDALLGRLDWQHFGGWQVCERRQALTA